MSNVKTAVRQFLSDNFILGGNITLDDDTSFMKRHILDSTGFIELIAFIEETYGLAVADSEMLPENFDSLANIDAYVARKRAG